LIAGISLSYSANSRSIALIVTDRGTAAYETVAEEIREGFKGEGSVEVYDMKDSDANGEKIAAKIASQNPSLVIALGDKAARLASSLLTAHPILIGMVLEMEAFKTPGIEGVGLQIPAQSVLTQLRLLVPNIRRIGVISSSGKFLSFRESIRSTVRGMGVQAVDIEIAGKEELEGRLARELDPLDAVWLLPDPRIVDRETFGLIVEKTKQAKKPLVAYSESFVKAGALFSVSPDYKATGQQLVLLAKKMLSKESVRPEHPYLAKFHYPIGSYSVLNLRTAEAIGLNLSQMQLGFVNRIVNGNSK
jgi:ABC-type uncharacterized transport system substrate-binding protein